MSAPPTQPSSVAIDAVKAVANNARPLRRLGQAAANPALKSNLRGSAAKLRTSGTVDQYKPSQRHHFDPAEANMRFSGGVLTAAKTAAMAKDGNRKMYHGVLLKDRPAATSPERAARVAARGVLPNGKENQPLLHKKPVNPFRGETLMGTSLSQQRGSANKFHRMNSLAAGKSDCDAGARPKKLNLVSEEFKSTCAPRALTNDERYFAAQRPMRRALRPTSAQQAVTPPWV